MEHVKVVVELAIAQTSFRGAYVYRFEAAEDWAQLLAHVGLPLRTTPEGCELRHQRSRNTPVALHAGAWQDPRFSDLPEFRAHRFECVVSIPLVDSGVVVGMVNFC